MRDELGGEMVEEQLSVMGREETEMTLVGVWSVRIDRGRTYSI